MTFRIPRRLLTAAVGLWPLWVGAGEPIPAPPPAENCTFFGYYPTQWRPFPPCPTEAPAPAAARPLLRTVPTPAEPRTELTRVPREPTRERFAQTAPGPVPPPMAPPPMAPPPAEVRSPYAVVRPVRETTFATIGKPTILEQPVAVVMAPKAAVAPVKHEVTPRPPADDVIRPAWPVIVPGSGNR